MQLHSSQMLFAEVEKRVAVVLMPSITPPPLTPTTLNPPSRPLQVKRAVAFLTDIFAEVE